MIWCTSRDLGEIYPMLVGMEKGMMHGGGKGLGWKRGGNTGGAVFYSSCLYCTECHCTMKRQTQLMRRIMCTAMEDGQGRRPDGIRTPPRRTHGNHNRNSSELKEGSNTGKRKKGNTMRPRHNGNNYMEQSGTNLVDPMYIGYLRRHMPQTCPLEVQQKCHRRTRKSWLRHTGGRHSAQGAVGTTGEATNTVLRVRTI